MCFSDTQRQNRLAKLPHQHYFEEKIVSWKCPTTSSNFPPRPLPPNFNVDFWNIREHVTAKINLPTLKMGEGGCFLEPLIEMPFWLLIFLTFLQFCQQFCRWVSEENFFRITLVQIFWHSQTKLRSGMWLQDHSWQNCKLWRHNLYNIQRHIFSAEKQSYLYK